MKNDILNSFCKVCDSYFGNSNSLHKLGTESKKLENASSKQILDVFNLLNHEVIYTSGNTESFNLMLLGFLDILKDKDKHIILFSNSPYIDIVKSINVSYDVIEYSNNIDISLLKSFIKDNTIFVELPICDNLDDILFILKDYSFYKYVDISNNYKLFDYSLCDFILIEDNDLLGFGCLLKRKNIIIEPIIHGGKSTTNYRSGTPVLPFIVSFSKLIKLKYKNCED